MTVEQLRELGYNKIADAAERNDDPTYIFYYDSDSIVDNFGWGRSPEGYDFWSYVDGGNFEESIKLCPQYRENSSVSSYKQVLIDAYKSQELSLEDFANTLEHYTELVKLENK